MTDNTPSYALSGILVPRKFSQTLAADYASGADYNEADRKPGAVTYSASAPRLVLEATGSIDSTLSVAISDNNSGCNLNNFSFSLLLSAWKSSFFSGSVNLSRYSAFSLVDSLIKSALLPILRLLNDWVP